MWPSYNDLSILSTVSAVYKWNTHYSAIPEILVVQLGDKLHLFDGRNEPLSLGKIKISDAEYISTGGTTSAPISAASVEGIFIFVVEGADPASLQITNVDKDIDGRFNLAIQRDTLDLKTRDLWGLNEPTKDRRDSLTTDSQYELENQGWDFEKLQTTYQAIGEYPSDYDIWWMYKTVSSTDPDAIGKFNPSLMKDNETTGIGQDRKNTPAPRGSTIASLKTLASGRPRVVQSYAGRVFYSGFSTTPRLIDDVRPDFGNHVFFSQTVKSNADITKCYQFADPSSEVDSDIVDTDGGFIKINSAINIIGLAEVSSGLFVLAENGVWLISGTTAGLFSATSYHVNKISDFGCLSQKSIVSYNNNVYYFADEGIIGLIYDNTAGTHVAQNLTETKIQTLYNNIGTSNKKNADATVQRNDRYLRWLVSEDSNPNSLTLEIVHSLDTGAFFINRIKTDTATPEVVLAYVDERNIVENVTDELYQVVVGLDDVLVENSIVTIGLSARTGDESYKDTKYLVGNLETGEFSFYQYLNENFEDFGRVDAEAFLLSAPQKLDDTQRRKQITSLATHMERTDTLFLNDGEVSIDDPSSLSLRLRWDYADSVNSGKWTRPRQCYRYRRPLNIVEGANVYPHSVITARERVRGSGTAFQFEFRTEPKNNAKLLGWATTVTGGTQV
jgi:hypothetical protein